MQKANITWHLEMALLAVLSFFLTGCVSSSSDSQLSYLAPPPPAQDMANVSYDEMMTIEAMDTKIVAASIPTAAQYKTNMQEPDCTMRQRLDRDNDLAYQWGDDQRHRLSFDVEGLDLSPFGGSLEIENVRLEYKIRLQKFKEKRERCRGGNNWQGLVGSGYREILQKNRYELMDTLRYGDEKF